MRVLFLTHRLPYAPNRGDRIRAYHLVRSLASQARIDLLSLVHDEEEAGHAQDLSPWVDSVAVARVPRAANMMRCLPALAGSRPLTHILLDSPEVRPALKRIRSSRPPDVVLAYCSGMARYIFEPELRQIPAVVDMVDVDSAKWAELGRASRWPAAMIFRREARVLARFEARTAMNVFATLTVNERERRTLAALAPSACVKVLPIGIDCDHFHPRSLPASDPVVIFCGVMNYAPNEQGITWMARHVWHRIRAARPDARLMVIGSSPSSTVRRLQNPGSGIVVTGEVPDVRPYLWDAALAVAPIWIGRGTQNKVLEAVAAGLPCVVTPPVAEGLPEEVVPACRVAADAEQFAAEILQLLNTGASERRAIAARARVAALDWYSQLAPLAALLHRAVESGRTGKR